MPVQQSRSSGISNRWRTNAKQPQQPQPQRKFKDLRGRNTAKTRLNKRSGKRRMSAGAGAQRSLRHFRQASIVAVAVTALLLLLLSPNEYELLPEEETAETVALHQPSPVNGNINLQKATSLPLLQVADDDLTDATNEVWLSLRGMWDAFYSNLPRILAVITILFAAWLISRMIKFVLYKLIGKWQRSQAIMTIFSISIWLMAFGIALSVLVGDLRAFAGSLGLVGLALSWALQTPIESFTGWVLNSFQGYYRVGDRVAVGEIYGDVYKIDFLTTTIWEMGGPYKVGFVNAEQPTGRLVTFANNEILSGSIVNFTRDFPYVWDELAVQVANESDFAFAMEFLHGISKDLLGNLMVEPAKQYEQILQRAHLEFNISGEPQVYLASQESWTDVVIRYLVPARERRKWKSELVFRINTEMNKPEVAKKMITVYPRQQVQFVNDAGMPVNSNFYNNGNIENA